jgi:hypothetical protein
MYVGRGEEVTPTTKKGGRVQNTLFGLFSFTSPQLSRKKDIKE